MTVGGPFDAGFPSSSTPKAGKVGTPNPLNQQIQHLNDALPLALAGVLGLGILAFFMAADEPSLRPAVALCGVSIALAALLFRRSRLARWLSLLPAIACVGFTSATWQAQRLGNHMLDEPAYSVTITGTVERVLWRSDGPRFILGQLKSDTQPALGRLNSVQIKWRGLPDGARADGSMLGQRVSWDVTLLPVRGAIVPGGFDFRRQAFFKGLSAYGYSLNPPTLGASQGYSRTEKWRQILRERFLRGLNGDAGGLATALVVGLRGDLSPRAEVQIRRAGLAHILAISGLHIGMVTGALFFLIRLLGAWFPALSLRLPMHRIAAVIALTGAFLYFTISGGSVPTQRATIVVALAMTAILIARRPFSLRSVGFAALLVLLLQPSSLVTASFQMSFAAVIGLIVAFRFSEARPNHASAPPRRAVNYFLGLAVSSLVATAATSVFALYHFQQLSLLGILANMIAVPLTALWIMPLLMLAALLAPLGVEGPVLWLAQFGLDGLLWLAAFAAQFESGLLTTRDWPAASLFLAGITIWLGALLVRPFTLLAGIPLALSVAWAIASPMPTIIADRGEGLLALSTSAPFLSFGDRPGAVMIAEGNGFATEQLSRFFNAKPQTCALETCIAEDRVWVSTNPQIAGHLCRTLPDAFGVTLSAAPTAACAKRQVRDLRALPRRGLRAFRADSLGELKDFSRNEAGAQRFWTTNPNL